ncbi:hypothetical protein Taro_014566 [Colocasia esculenta]|uniref:Uncharacterized protein n=1 Tax=Colocasia esculenta TaxID=4460 RepID=A0A843UJR9_COLES|nr:hypothetical protein [Colocasia esculenta]
MEEISGYLLSVRCGSGVRRYFGVRGTPGRACPDPVSTVKVCVVFLDTLTPEFELYIQMRDRWQGVATRVCGSAVACSVLMVGGWTLGSRPESLKVSGLGLQQCSLQVWSWFVSIILDLVEVERQLDLSSVAVRLRGRLVLFVRLWRNCPTEPVTCEDHPFFFQVKESRRVPIPLLLLVAIIVESGIRHQ